MRKEQILAIAKTTLENLTVKMVNNVESGNILEFKRNYSEFWTVNEKYFNNSFRLSESLKIYASVF